MTLDVVLRYRTRRPWAPGPASLRRWARLAALALSQLGDGLRDLLDPRTRRALTQVAAPSTLPRPAAGGGE